MKYKFIILLLLITSINIHAQGFDWQYSARLPFNTPHIFVGADASGGYNFLSGDFKICDQNIPCDTFDIGNATSISAGIKFEYWHSSDFSIFSTLSFNYSKNTFLNENLFYYFPEIGTKKMEYEYSRTEYIPNIEIGVKYRMMFLLPHLFSAFSLKTGFAFVSNEELILRKISEADWLADEIQFTGFESLKLSPLVLEPHIKIGYDINLGLGSYSSVYIDLGFPLINRYSEGLWRSTSISAGISIFPIGI